jgi:carboxymethylenebutenolidase
MIEEERKLSTADGEQTVVVKRPDGDGPFPVVVMFHDGPGMREDNHEVARRIAAAGYYAAVPDRYYRHGRFVHVDPVELRAAGPGSDLFDEFVAVLQSVSDEMMLADLDVLLGAIDADPAAAPPPMAVIGFCIGGRYVLRTLAAHGDRFGAGAALHPSFCVTEGDDSPHRLVGDLKAELYVGVGEADQMSSVATNQPLLDAVAGMGERGGFDVLPGADHGFAVPGPTYLATAADRAYEQSFARFARMGV